MTRRSFRLRTGARAPGAPEGRSPSFPAPGGESGETTSEAAGSRARAGGGLDVWRLAGVVAPGVARGSRARLARALGIALDPEPPSHAAQAAEEEQRILAACRERLAALALPTLQALARLFATSASAEGRVISEAFQAKARRAFGDAAEPGPADRAEEELPLAPIPGHSSGGLQPAKYRKPVDQAAIRAAFVEESPLASVLPGYEPRPGQVTMARAVAKSLNEQLHLLVEAGTGTGKSLAYLVPAVQFALANGRRVVVSTNTINLQEQLFAKDIPLLREALSVPFRAAVLKGRSNYLCLRRWRTFMREGVGTDPDRFLAAKILIWLQETRTGDRTELALDEYEGARWAAALAADALHCTPQMCRDHRIGRCFLSRARRDAEAAHILVVNHALLLADQALESKVLPEYGDLVVDEAHHLEDTATDQLGVNVSQLDLSFFLAAVSQQQGPGRYAGLVSRAQAVLISAGGAPMRNEAGEITQPAHDAVERARRELHTMFDAIATFARSVGESATPVDREMRLTSALRATETWAAVEGAWHGLASELEQTETALARIAGALEPFGGTAEIVDDALADLEGARSEITDARVDLSAIVVHPSDDAVYWLQVRERGGPSGGRAIALRAAPLDVGALLQRQLFSQKDCVVLTSATLQVNGSFRHIRERLGLDEHTFTLAVPSPFDYPAQALLCVPHDLPDPSTRAFLDAANEALESICAATGGRTLVLFTSHSALRAAHAYLQRRLPRLTILGQGLDGSRQHLLEQFRETPSTVLLGTSSFWEGIDVVGEALSCLVIVKLPFSVPSDPVFAARSELYEEPFGQYALPQAVLRLKQGFGRLIRSSADRGAVVILDSRLWTKRYGSAFLRSLPPATLHRCAWQEVGRLVQDWLRPPDRAAARR